MNKYPAALLMILSLVIVGCGQRVPEEVFIETVDNVNATGTMADEHMACFRKFLRDNRPSISYGGLTSITDEQAEILSKVGNLGLNGLTSIDIPPIFAPQ